MANKEAGSSTKSGLASRAAQRAKQEQESQRRQLTLVGVVIVLVVLIFAGLLFFLSRTSAAPLASNGSTSAYALMHEDVTPSGAPVLGDPEARIVVMEFADFSCPHCLEYHPTIQDFIKKYVATGHVRFIMQPQTFVGGNYSKIAAEAALCANQQYATKSVGFWEVNDVLFDIQASQSRLGFTLSNISQQIAHFGFDTGAITTCVAGGSMDGVLQQSEAAFGKYLANVQGAGTPTMMISTDGGQNFDFFKDNGKPISNGGPSADVLASTLNSLINGGS